MSTDRTPALPSDLLAVVRQRRTVRPRWLLAPAPDAVQLRAIFEAAAAAPDHGELGPWRLVLIPSEMRAGLGEAFAQALRERDGDATPEQLERARAKAFHAPVLLLAVCRSEPDLQGIPLEERILSAGCAIQNMLLVATAMGFGSALTSGKAMASRALHAFFRLAPHEQALCFISFGTAARVPTPANRREAGGLVSVLRPDAAVPWQE